MKITLLHLSHVTLFSLNTVLGTPLTLLSQKKHDKRCDTTTPTTTNTTARLGHTKSLCTYSNLSLKRLNSAPVNHPSSQGPQKAKILAHNQEMHLDI